MKTLKEIKKAADEAVEKDISISFVKMTFSSFWQDGYVQCIEDLLDKVTCKKCLKKIRREMNRKQPHLNIKL